jgi:hypothetical protein
LKLPLRKEQKDCKSYQDNYPNSHDFKHREEVKARILAQRAALAAGGDL